MPRAELMSPDGLREDMLKKFWWFLKERQAIWHNRFVLKKSPPWTEDPVLRAYKFCNVYRELDRGTIYCVNEILSCMDKQAVVFNVMVYRMFNLPSTYDVLGFVKPSRFDSDRAEVKLQALAASGQKVFSHAYMLAGTGLHGRGAKIKDYCRVLGGVAADKGFLRNVLAAGGMEEAWRAVRLAKWFGPFVAYQVVLDLAMVLGWDQNEWCYIGPGALRGVGWLQGQESLLLMRGPKPQGDVEATLRWLLAVHEDVLGSQFKWLMKGKSRIPLTLQNVEFALCEFNKYQRALHGGRRYSFEPSAN